ncbi:MAG: hypothetical protein M3308_03375 [Actinomycetota bacterium]|nr:hypothetical protein [Actinomycetota bacterium]
MSNSNGTVAVLIETHGKQAYLFDTSRRRESVGASQLVHEVARWSRAALDELVGDDAVGAIDAGAQAEVLVETSGTFLAFVRDRDVARQVVQRVTLQALRDAPGLGVSGGISEPFAWGQGSASTAVSEAFAAVGHNRVARPAPLARFPVLPITALCPSSALPVSDFVPIGARERKTLEARSAVSAARWRAHGRAVGRLAGLTGLDRKHLDGAARRLDGNQPGSPSRVAVVHADGNGLGGVFTQLPELLRAARHGAPVTDGEYAAAYRDLSAALDEAVDEAFQAAISTLVEITGVEPDVLPLVLAGDDITFITEATVAATLTRTFLTGMIRRVAADPRAADLLRARPGGDPRIGMAGAMVVTTPHFPFSAAYQLCEELVTEVAKQAKDRVVDTEGHPVPCLSLALHLQLDSSATGVDQLRAVADQAGRHLTAMPYVDRVEISAVQRELSERSAQWLRNRDLDGLEGLASALVEKDEDNRRVRPSAQLHELRARLRPYPAAADEYFGRLLAADAARWQPLTEDPGSLFSVRPADPPTTRFADALALGPLLAQPATSREGSGA